MKAQTISFSPQRVKVFLYTGYWLYACFQQPFRLIGRTCTPAARRSNVWHINDVKHRTIFTHLPLVRPTKTRSGYPQVTEPCLAEPSTRDTTLKPYDAFLGGASTRVESDEETQITKTLPTPIEDNNLSGKAQGCPTTVVDWSLLFREVNNHAPLPTPRNSRPTCSGSII